MRRRLTIAWSILGAYFIASYLILHAAIDQQRSMQRAISVSGQQRMYSQRIAMFADAIVARPDPGLRHRAQQDLQKSIRIFDEAHRELTDGDPKINPFGWPPPSVRGIYFTPPYQVDRQAHDYLAHARALNERAKYHTIAADDKNLEYLLNVGPGLFLQSLDAVVVAYAHEQRDDAAKFELLQVGLLVLGFSTLGLIWFTILMPMDREITERAAAMERSAALDSLTGLLNRKAFAARVEIAIARVHADVHGGALLMIDIDNFKTINDTFGHGFGDDTIVTIAEIMRRHAREHDLIGRFGGDEFAVFVAAFESEATLHDFVDRICTALQYDTNDGGDAHRVTVSIGVARVGRDGTNLADLFTAADEALYAAKRSGRARYAFAERSTIAEAAIPKI
jgi:diguanylate cyclase (GGDEF)-like protein